MINVSELLSDPDFAQSFTINRSTGAFVLGGWQSSTTALARFGVVTVAKERDLEQLPEGDLVSGGMLFFSTKEIFLSTGGTAAGASDTITWRGDTYRMAKVWPYGDFGYWQALGVRVSGD